MRKVQVFKWEQQLIDGRNKNVKVADFVGTFHQFGQDDNGGGQSAPVAIIEAPDGRVLSLYCEMIQFVEPTRAGPSADAFVLIITLQRLDGYMDAAQYGADHPWRIEIRSALAAAGAA